MSNPLGLKNPYKRLAKGLDQLLEQQQFTRWFYETIASSDFKSDNKKKLQFINGVLSNLRMIKKNIGNAGVGAGLVSTPKTIDVYNDKIDHLIEIVVKNKPDDVATVAGTVSPHGPPQEPVRERSPGESKVQPYIPVAPVVGINYTSFSSIPKAIQKTKKIKEMEHYLDLMASHQTELDKSDGVLTPKLLDIHNQLRDMEHHHRVSGAQRQFRTVNQVFGSAGTPKWRKLWNKKGGPGKMSVYRAKRTKFGGKRRTRRRRRKRKTRKHRKKKRTRRRKPKKRHRRTRKK